MGNEERPRIKAISKMDDETFLKHMDARHAGACGLQHFGKSNVTDDRAERILRGRHEVLHSGHPYEAPNHTHGNEEQ